MDTITLLTCLTLAAAGLVAGPLLVSLAHRRAGAQPLDVAPDAERLVVGHALADPCSIAEGDELRGDDFADPGLGDLWEAAKAAFADMAGEDVASADLIAVLDGDHRAPLGSDLLQELADLGAGTTRAQFIRAGEKVMVAHEDRTTYAGRGATVPDGRGGWTRDLPAPSAGRRATIAAVTAAALGASPWLAADVAEVGSVAWLVTVATMVVLTAMGVLVSLVDIDTLRIDLETFAVLGAVSWAGALVAGWAGAGLSVVVAALVATAVIVGLFEVLNAVFRRLRGHDGQGFGDTLLALVVIGVPVALHGDWLLAYWTLMVSVVAVLVAYVIRRARGEDHDTAKLTPFGPYLAAAWIVAWAAMTVGVAPTLL